MITDVSNASIPTQTTIKITGPRVCKVCGAPAQYSFFGSVACHSCKIFFKRNAQTRSVC